MNKSHFTLVILLILISSLSGCSFKDVSKPEHMTNHREDMTEDIPIEYIKLSPDEALFIASLDAIILDVRTKEQYDAEHIINAISLPSTDVSKNIERLIPDKNQIILIYSGLNRKSEYTTKELIELGYTEAYDIGTLAAWKGEIVGNKRYSSYYNYFDDSFSRSEFSALSFKLTQKINEELPEFTFHIGGHTINYNRISWDKSKIISSSAENYINNITVTDSSSSFIQTINIGSVGNWWSDDEMYGFKLADWNFDGYLDICINTIPYYYDEGTYLYWLWDNELQQFVPSDEYRKLYDYYDIFIDTENELIMCYEDYGWYSSVVTYFKCIDNKLVTVYNCETRYDWNRYDGDEWFLHTIIQEMVDGKLVVVKDYYEPLD